MIIRLKNLSKRPLPKYINHLIPINNSIMRRNLSIIILISPILLRIDPSLPNIVHLIAMNLLFLHLCQMLIFISIMNLLMIDSLHIYSSCCVTICVIVSYKLIEFSCCIFGTVCVTRMI